MNNKTAIYSAKLSRSHAKFAGTSPWQHHKGGIYKIEDYAINSDTKEVDLIMSRIGGLDFDPVSEVGIKFTRPSSELEDPLKWKRVKRVTRSEWVAL